MDFYNRVKEMVKNKSNLTLRAFIESLNINYDSYNGLKRYNNFPRADEAVKIAQALNTSVEYLMTGNEPDTYKEKYDNLKNKIESVLKEES